MTVKYVAPERICKGAGREPALPHGVPAGGALLLGRQVHRRQLARRSGLSRCQPEVLPAMSHPSIISLPRGPFW